MSWRTSIVAHVRFPIAQSNVRNMTGKSILNIVNQCRKFFMRNLKIFILNLTSSIFHRTLISKPFKSLTPSQIDKMESSEETPKSMLEEYITKVQDRCKSEPFDAETSMTNSSHELNKDQSKSPEAANNAAPKMYGDNSVKKKNLVIPSIDKPKLHSRVVLTSVSDSKVVYIRPVDQDLNESFQQLINSIQTYSVHAKLITKNPEKYDVFLAPFQNEYCRVFILNVNKEDQTCFVSYLDYGNTGVVSYEDLRCINNQTKYLKRHTFKVILTEVNANKENPDVQMYIDDLLENSKELVITKVHEKDRNMYVELFEVENKMCVNTKLNQLSEIQEATFESQSYYLTVIVANSFFEHISLSSLFLTKILCMPLRAHAQLFDPKKEFELFLIL